MKRSIKKIAAFAVLSIFFVSCTDDLETSPSIPEEAPSELSFLQGEWEPVDNNGANSHHRFQFVDDIALQKGANGIIVRASNFNVVKGAQGNTIVYNSDLVSAESGGKIPDFFKNNRIVSLSPDELVLEGNGIQRFKKLDPVN